MAPVRSPPQPNANLIGLLAPEVAASDEAHCISQWGEAFRPAYRSIPAFIKSTFGYLTAVPVLSLTATLSTDDQQQICADFELSSKSIKRSSFLLRKNLKLSFETLEGSGAINERFPTYASASPIGATLDIVKRTGIPISQILEDLYT